MGTQYILQNNINKQREQDIQHYNTQQQQLKDQKRQQEVSSFKTALDKVPMFMDRKLTDDNKRTILNEYTNGAAENLLKNPEKVAKFMLWEKYGEQGLKYMKARVLEDLTLEKAKQQHNVPTTQTGAGGQNRVTTTNQNFNSGMDRLSADDNYKQP